MISHLRKNTLINREITLDSLMARTVKLKYQSKKIGQLKQLRNVQKRCSLLWIKDGILILKVG